MVAEGFNKLPFYEREYIVLRAWRGSYPLEPWCYTPREVVELLEHKPRIDLVDAVEKGIAVYGGFGVTVKAKYAGKWRLTRHGLVLGESRQSR